MSLKSIVVIGAGLSGLCCARKLQQAGHNVHIYEASDGVGGRVRTDEVDGFLLDRGFQVMFTAYPAIRQEMNLDRLNLRSFESGAIVSKEGRRSYLSDPTRNPAQLFVAATFPLFGLADKLKTLKLRSVLGKLSIEQIFEMPDKTLENYLREYGFSDAFLDNFIRPFYGGIFLERELQTSARMFAFVFKMLSEGETAVPERGMGALSEQIAADLSPETLHLNSPVESLLKENGHITGLLLTSGEKVEADTVIVATEADAAARLTGLEIPTEHRASTCLYFSVLEPLYADKLVMLFADPNALVNNATMITNVAPSYAPQGQHLLSVTVLGDPPFPDESLARRVIGFLRSQFPKADTEAWRLLKIYRVRWAQFAQTPHVWERLPSPKTAVPGLILAGEITQSSSVHGALVAGQRAAALAQESQ